MWDCESICLVNFANNFLTVEVTGALIHFLVAPVIYIFSFGKLKSFVEMKFEACYRESEESVINCNIMAIKTTDPVVLSEVKLLNVSSAECMGRWKQFPFTTYTNLHPALQNLDSRVNKPLSWEFTRFSIYL